MNHLNEEELVLHYFGEGGEASHAFRIESHLDDCAECHALYESIQHAMAAADSMTIPERDADYGEQVWRRVEARLPVRRARWEWLQTPWLRVAAASAFASLLIAAFLLGRFYPWGYGGGHRPEVSAADSQSGERILQAAVGDYLERSQIVLIELANASPKGSLNISAEQERAADLVMENRLYRQTAVHVGDAAIAGVLEELERTLVEITHSPSEISPGDLERLRQRLEADGILFKIRVFGKNAQKQGQPAVGLD
jgi:hypothetical protein